MSQTSENFLPAATGQTLGSAGQQWTIHAQDITVYRNFNAYSLNSVRMADQFSGANAAAKIQAAHDDLSSAGGVIDARALTGSQSGTSTITISKPVTILVGPTTLTSSASPVINFASGAGGSSLIGIERTSSILRTSHGTGDILQFNQGSGAYISIQNLGFRATVSRTGGAAINIVNGAAHIRHIRIDTTYDGINLKQTTANAQVNDVWMGAGLTAGGSWNSGIYIGNVASSTVTSSHFHNVLISGDASFATALCVVDGGADAINFSQCQFVQGGSSNIALKILANTGSYPEWIKFTNCYFEGGTSADGVVVSECRDVEFNNCYIATSKNGLTVGANATGLKWIGGAIFNNQRHGWYGQGSNWQLIGAILGDNGQETNNTYDDIRVDANMNDWLIAHCRTYDLLGTAPANKVKYNLEIAAGTSDRFQIISNQFNTNATGAYSNGGTGSSQQVYGNIPTTISNSVRGATSFESAVTFNAATTYNSVRVLHAKGSDVASAGDLTLGSGGNLFHVTGNTTINAITTTSWQAGAEVTLIFDSTPTVKHNTAGGAGTAKMLLAGAADLSATANDTLTLIYDGTSWFEKSRAVI